MIVLLDLLALGADGFELVCGCSGRPAVPVSSWPVKSSLRLKDLSSGSLMS